MRFSIGYRCLPRGAHPPNARFLQQKSPSQSFLRDRQQTPSQHEPELINTSYDLLKISPILSNNSSPSQSHPKDEKTSIEIPSSPSDPTTTDKISEAAPTNASSILFNTNEFTTLLRNKKNRKKICILNPHSYYRQSTTKSTKESVKPRSAWKQSPFTQLNNLLRSEAMSSTPSNNPNPPTPEDATMDTTNVISPEKPTTNPSDASPEPPQDPTDAIVQEFDSHKFQTPAPKPSAQHVSSNVRPTLTKPAATNVGMFTSIATPTSQPNLAAPPSIAQQNSTGTMKVRQVTKNIITFRYRLKVSQSSCNLPFMVKQVTKMLREIDPSIHILPFGSSNCNHVLDHEDNLPTEENSLKTWVKEISTWKDRLQFTMKYGFVKELDALKGPVFAWMKANSSYVKLDQIDSESITCVGFFEGLHPDFRNRELFKKHCQTHLSTYMQNIDPNFSCKLSIFPRGVYAGAGINKKETRGVVMEVASSVSDTILQAFSQPFQGLYSDITFIPFTKTDDTYSSTLSSIITHQNTMLHSTRRKVLPELQNLYDTITTKDGRSTTLHEWLSSASDPSVPNEKLIKAIDLTTKNSVCILFHENHDPIITKLLQGMNLQLQQCFADSEISKVLDPTRKIAMNTPTRVISESEKTWVDLIKRKYSANPQSTDMETLSTPPPKNRKVIYYGPSSKPSQMIENTFDQKPAEPDTSNESRLANLEKSLEQLTSSQNEQISTSVNSLEQKLVLRINQNNDKMNARMSTIENGFSHMTNLFSKNFETITNKLDIIVNNKPTSLPGHTLSTPESTTAAASSPGLAGGKHQ